MRSKWLSDYWQGTILGLSAIIAALWLGWNGKLSLYIHPRYILFTVVMCGLGLGAVLLGFWQRSYKGKIMDRCSVPGILLGLLCLMTSLSLLVAKPSALTSDTATQRGINTAALDVAQSSETAVRLPRNTDYSRFSVKEWASLLSQTTDTKFFERKEVDVIGFVSPHGNDPDVFFVSRFVISCCAVDARPVGVPVHLPGWRATHKPDQWVRTKGIFIVKPGALSDIVVKPGSITKVNQPNDPYAY